MQKIVLKAKCFKASTVLHFTLVIKIIRLLALENVKARVKKLYYFCGNKTRLLAKKKLTILD